MRKTDGGLEREAVESPLLNFYKNTINVAANLIKLRPCSCRFNLMEKESEGAFSFGAASS